MHVKLKGSPAFYLVGFMGCGKTTVGRRLADRLKWDFVDLDEEIEREAEAKIVDIFDKFGEAAFRVMERQALNKQIRHARMGMARVVALGGLRLGRPAGAAANWRLRRLGKGFRPVSGEWVGQPSPLCAGSTGFMVLVDGTGWGCCLAPCAVSLQ